MKLLHYLATLTAICLSLLASSHVIAKQNINILAEQHQYLISSQDIAQSTCIRSAMKKLNISITSRQKIIISPESTLYRTIINSCHTAPIANPDNVSCGSCFGISGKKYHCPSNPLDPCYCKKC